LHRPATQASSPPAVHPHDRARDAHPRRAPRLQPSVVHRPDLGPCAHATPLPSTVYRNRQWRRLASTNPQLHDCPMNATGQRTIAIPRYRRTSRPMMALVALFTVLLGISRPRTSQARELDARARDQRRRERPSVSRMPGDVRIDRETASASFVALRHVETQHTHVYRELDIDSRPKLARTLDGQVGGRAETCWGCGRREG
jgi:hypothetical protein